MTLDDYVNGHESPIFGRINKVSNLFRKIDTSNEMTRVILDDCQLELFEEMFYRSTNSGNYDFIVSHYCIGSPITVTDIDIAINEVTLKLSKLGKSFDHMRIVMYNGFEFVDPWSLKSEIMELNKIRWQKFPTESYNDLSKVIEFMNNPEWVNVALINNEIIKF